MSTPLPHEDEVHYTEVIDGILATANLETITRKKIRQGLETALGGKDLSAHKDAIKVLIESRFDAVSTGDVPPSSVPPPDSSPVKRPANGYDDASASADEAKSSAPPKKKPRKEKSEETEDADAKLAAMLQAQENSRTRSTRGGGSKPAPKKKKAAPRKKSSNKVRPEDDSDLEGSETAKPRKAGGGFQKPFNLSFQLAEICGEPQLSRPQVVKKLWEHIKGNELQDPSDKRQIRCDEKMQAVFKQSRVDMFSMNKLVGNHLYPVEEET